MIDVYVLITNHINILVTLVTKNSLPLMMQAIGRKYVRYINGNISAALCSGLVKSIIELEAIFP